MSEWFTIDRLDSMTYAISEWGHWEEVHAYLFLGTDRAALVDTGTGIGAIKRLVNELTNLPIMALTTHAHWDHTGGHGLFDCIAVHPDDADWLSRGLPISDEEVRRTLLREPFRRQVPPGFDPQRWHPFRGEPTDLIVDGQMIDLGGRSLTVVHTPGHSPGHVCFHESATGYLITGDLVYSGELQAFYPSTDPIAFADSVKRLMNIRPVSQLLPGHHRMPLQVDFLREVSGAFHRLRSAGNLRHGGGLHDFGNFSIRL